MSSWLIARLAGPTERLLSYIIYELRHRRLHRLTSVHAGPSLEAKTGKLIPNAVALKAVAPNVAAMNATATGPVPVPVLEDNHREDGWLAVCILMTVVETAFFVLRVCGRRFAGTSWWLDDHLVLLGYVACMALNAFSIAITRATWIGQHTLDVLLADHDSLILFLKLQIPLTVTYACAAVLPKMAIVALFIRVFIQRPFKIVCWVLEALLAAYLISMLGAILASCTSFSAQWQLPGTFTAGERCVDYNAMYKAVSMPNLVSDVVIILLPVPMVWRMPKTTMQKLGLLSTFCLGFVGLAFSAARLVAFFSVYSAEDVLWTGAYVGIFTTLEPASYFLVACMPTFRQLKHTPCLPRNRKARRIADIERQRGDSIVTRRGSDQNTVVAVNSNEDEKAPDGVVLEYAPSIEAAKAVHMRPVTKHGAAEELGRAHNTVRYTGSATAVYDGATANHVQPGSSAASDDGRGIMVKQEVIVSKRRPDS